MVQGLSALVGESVSWTREWPPYKSSRAFLLPALAAACARRISLGPFAPGLAEAVALVLRLGDHIDEADQHLKALREQVAALGVDSRATLFWIEDAFRQSSHPELDAGRRFWEAARHDPIRLDAERDTPWMRVALRDTRRPVPERAMTFDAVLRHVWDGQGTWDDHVRRVQAEVADIPELVAAAERLLAPVMPDPEQVKLEASWQEREAKQARQQADDHDSWKRL